MADVLLISKTSRVYKLWFTMSLYFTILSLGPNIMLGETGTITSPVYYTTAGLYRIFQLWRFPGSTVDGSAYRNCIVCNTHAKYSHAWIASVLVLYNTKFVLQNPFPLQNPSK